MTNGISNHALHESAFAPSRRYLRAHWGGAFHLCNQKNRPFGDRVESEGGRRGLPFGPGCFVDPLFVAQPGMAALYESGRAAGGVLGAVAGEAGGRGGRRCDIRGGGGRAGGAHWARRLALAVIGDRVAGG